MYQVLTDNSLEKYVLFWFLSVSTNLTYIFTISHIKREEYLALYGSKTTIFIVNLSNIIPFSIFYVLSSIAFAGFDIPFKN